MKRHLQTLGVRKWSGNDLLELQSEGLSVLDNFFAQYGNCIIDGCEVAENTISKGLVSIDGMVLPFDGATDIHTFPVYLKKSEIHEQREYADGVVRDIAVQYYAEMVLVEPSDSHIKITAEANIKFYDKGWIGDINKILLQLDIPTLSAEPTAETLTYVKDGKTYHFWIGQQCRIYDETNKKYIFFQLYDIDADNIANWQIIGSQELPKSDRIDLEDSDTLATSKAVATLNKKIKPLAQATETVLGGIKAKPRTTETLEVAIDTESGKLFADSVIDDLPVNTILQTTDVAGNIFGEKWLKCDGSLIDIIDYPKLKMLTKINWTSITIPTNTAWISLKYINGKFIFFAEEGIMITSTDAIKWTTINTKFGTDDIIDMVYANGLYIIYGYHNMATSPDCIVWTTKSYSLNVTHGDIVIYGGGIFLISKADNTKRDIRISSDNIIWTQHVTPTSISDYFCTIIYAENKFVGGTKTGKILTSNDGITWNEIANLNKNIRRIIYANNLYVAVGLNFIAISSNAIDWEFVNEGILFNDISYNDGIFVTIGNVIMTSTDGINWIRRGEGNMNYASYVLYVNGLFIMTGSYSFMVGDESFPLPTINNSYIKALE